MSVDLDCLANSYQSVVDFLGEEKINLEVLEKFHYMFKGQQISYPMKLYDKELVAEKIKKDYKENRECNIRELTDRYGFSTRWVQNVLKQAKKEEIE